MFLVLLLGQFSWPLQSKIAVVFPLLYPHHLLSRFELHQIQGVEVFQLVSLEQLEVWALE